MAITRDEQGRQVLTIEETEDSLGMAITDGALYRFRGLEYVASLENTASDTLAGFAQQSRLNDGPSLWLERDGSLTTYAMTDWGDYNELEMI